jgi:hypothetical protein
MDFFFIWDFLTPRQKSAPEAAFDESRHSYSALVSPVQGHFTRPGTFQSRPVHENSRSHRKGQRWRATGSAVRLIVDSDGNAMKKGYHCGSLCFGKSIPSIKKNATQKGTTIIY